MINMRIGYTSMKFALNVLHGIYEDISLHQHFCAFHMRRKKIALCLFILISIQFKVYLSKPEVLAGCSCILDHMLMGLMVELQ